jgi:hypothetical protein
VFTRDESALNTLIDATDGRGTVPALRRPIMNIRLLRVITCAFLASCSGGSTASILDVDSGSTDASSTNSADAAGGGDAAASNDAASTGGDTSGNDAGSPTDGGAGTMDATIACGSPAPVLHADVPDAGPFCGSSGMATRCTYGQHCCRDSAGNNPTCMAGACPGGDEDFACLGPSECGGLQCCMTGKPSSTQCTYATLDSVTGSKCAVTCGAGEVIACAGNGDCPLTAPTCTPARPVSGTKTELVELSFCK